jgi:putative ABC transport system permease protein
MRDLLSPRWRKMLRDAWLHKSRSLLVILAITVSMIATGALLNAWALVQRVTAVTYRGSHPASATLRLDHVEDAWLARVRAMPEIAAARVRGVVMATVITDNGDLVAELFALQNLDTRDIGRLESERGEWPPRDGSISIEKSSLEFSGAALGGSLRLRVGKNSVQTLRVSGIARDVSLPPGWMDHLVYGFVTPETLSLLGVTTPLNEIQFVMRDSSADRDAVRRVAADIKAMIEHDGGHVVNVDVPVPGRHAHAAQMDSLMFTQGAFGLLTLLVCSFLIVNLITAMLTGQTREIGVMKSLGARAGQITAMYLGFALLLGLIASAIALPATVAIGRPYAALKADMLNFSVYGFAIPWWAIGLQIILGCLLPVAAAAIPVARACRQPVSAALRDPGIATENGSGFLRRRMSIPGLGRPLLLSIGNAFRRRQRMLLTLLALAAGGAVYLGADDLRHAVRDSVDSLFASERYDIVLRLNDAYPATDSAAVASRVAGVARVQAVVNANATLTHIDGVPGNSFAMLGVPSDSPMFAEKIVQGRWLDVDDRNALVVSEALLNNEPTLTPGSDIELTIEGEATRWRVVGISHAIQPVAYAPLVAFNTLRGNDRASTLIIATSEHDAATQLSVIGDLREALDRAGMPVASSRLMGEGRRAVEDHLLMVVQFLAVMGWVMIIVGGMGLGSTMGLAVLERRREIGVMRALGARGRTIVGMIVVEGLVIATLGWLASIPLSIPISAFLADMFGRVMFSIPVRYLPTLTSLLVWLLLVVAVTLVACAWPAHRSTRVAIVTSLSYE